MEHFKTGVNVKLSSVSRYFSNSDIILDRLTFNIDAGEFISILGPSGCGKSTLLRLIADLDKADEGTIQLDYKNSNPDRGFVFQEPRLLPWLSVLENIKLPLLLKGQDHETSNKKAINAIKRVELLNCIQKFPRQLSGGMKMRVSIARALVVEPSLLLFDEPFSALDEQTRHAFQTDLRNLWHSLGMTIVFVTHSISEAVYLSNRIIILSRAPAKILSDQFINLPKYRAPIIRLESSFIKEIQKITKSFPTRLEI